MKGEIRMAQPEAYEPAEGYMYQILTRYGNEPYEHCDYAKDKKELLYLLEEYRLAYRSSNPKFKSILLPQKYHPK